MSTVRRNTVIAVCCGTLALVLVGILAIRGPSSSPSDLATSSPSESSTPGRAVSTSQLLGQVHARFDPQSPGRGVTDYPGNTEEHIPKSYAMILLAELERRRHGIRPDLADMSDQAGRWLLDNAKLNEDGTVGWGVPVAWDAYGDGSENPADTVYAISTAIVADALMSWMESTPTAPGPEILETLSVALDNFAQAPKTPDGLLPYSLQESDRVYDTFNPAAYLAGQMQRFAKYAVDPELATRLRTTADATVSSLLRNRKTSRQGAWYWQYSIQEDVTNDMAHAGYIIDGLRTYVREQGRLSARVDVRAVTGHLREFFDKTGAPRAWPRYQKDIDNPPRLYDLGMGLTLACSDPTVAELSVPLKKVLPTYRSTNGTFLKYPAGMADQEALVVNEYEAYLWRGLVACTSRDLAGAGSKKARSPKPARVGSTEGLVGGVPFVRIGSDKDMSAVSFRDGRSTLALPWSPGRRVVQDGLVLEAFDDDAGGVLITRGHPSNDLSIVTLSRSGGRPDELPIEVSADSAPILRGALLHDGLLYVVYYDNPSLTNYLARYKRGSSGYVAAGEPVALPTLEDPGGATYEMIPAIFLDAARDKVHLLGGTLQAEITSDGRLTHSRIPNCLRVLEAVVLPRGPVALCQQTKERGPGAPFEIHGPNVPLPSIGGGSGVPFGLTVKNGQVRVQVADTPKELASMLQFDLERANSGWLELGTDNVEGRVAWSQIYYLNGFLDFLLLADSKERDWRAFSPLMARMRARLDQEVAIADRQWSQGRYETRAFTVDRSKSLFAVQTSRLLLLMERYASELRNPRDLPGHRQLRAAVTTLTDHIEVLAIEGQAPHWLPPRVPYLKWPKGSGFSFDGLNVPYNHQNEWAYALVRAGKQKKSVATARWIVEHFLRRVAPDGRLPQTGTWDYWWGQAYDGWDETEAVSVNRPAYDGDHIQAAMSFRSIDAMSALAVAPGLDASTRHHLRSSAAALIEQGELYPFVGYELHRAGWKFELPEAVARRHIRVSSPWELQSAAWAYSAELSRVASPQQ